MENEDILYRYNPWWENGKAAEGLFDRPAITDTAHKSLGSKSIMLFTGLRRVGKTSLMKLVIQKILDSGSHKPRNIFFISLDDYLLKDKSIPEIIDDFRAVHKIPFKEKVIIFLDEITYVNDFEQQLKNIYDSQNVKVFASSSSASSLKSKKPFLTGRSSIIEVLPLDFEEYLLFKKIHIGKADEKLKQKYFEDFLSEGGMPEYILTGNTEHLRELVDDIIYKDIVAVHGVKDPHLIKDYFLLLMERAGKQVSLNKVANILGITVDSAKRYLGMFADTFLIDLVPRYGKTNQRLLGAKKVYAADLGIRNLFTGVRDIGSLFENYVYQKIKSRRPSYVYESETELDFFTEDKTLIEVKFGSELNEKQRRLFNEFKAKQKLIISNYRDVGKI
jgi:hypothetical protein